MNILNPGMLVCTQLYEKIFRVDIMYLILKKSIIIDICYSIQQQVSLYENICYSLVGGHMRRLNMNSSEDAN